MTERATIPSTVDALHPPVASVETSKITELGFPAMEEIVTENGPVPIADASVLGHSVKIWDGVQFAEGTVRPASAQQEMVRVTLSDGRTFKCAADLPLVLHNGDKRPAKDVSVGTKLHRSMMPVYPGKDGECSTSFLAGFVYGSGMKNATVKNAGETKVVYRVPWAQTPKKLQKKNDDGSMTDIDNPHLESLGYNKEKAVEYTRKNQIDYDHTAEALIIIPTGMQEASIPHMATVEERKKWVAGFVLATRKYSLAEGHQGNVVNVRNMVCSTDPKYEVTATCVDSNIGKWGIRALAPPIEDVKARAELYPTVWAVSKCTDKNILYTVDGLDSVMINGVVVGTH